MRVSQATVSEILAVPGQYRIPLYQRPFPWKQQHLDRLWGDLLQQVEAAQAQKPQPLMHFLGTMVRSRTPDERSSGLCYYIVDGQQRLTTLLLILAALRDFQREERHNGEAADRLDGLLTHKEARGDLRLRLVPTATDLKSFRALILDLRPEDPLQHQRHRIYGTYTDFFKKIRGACRGKPESWLGSLEEAVLTRLNLAVITLDSEENPHEIFESLNDKGMPLAQADLVRNFLFMNLGGRADEVYERYWVALQHQLSGTHIAGKAPNTDFDEDLLAQRLNRMLWVELLVEGVDKPPFAEIYKRTKESFGVGVPSGEDIESYIYRLHARSLSYQQMLQPDPEMPPSVVKRLKRLALWKVNAIEPAVLYLLQRMECDAMTAAQAAMALGMIESFLARRTIAGKSMQGLTGIFQSVPGVLKGEGDPIEKLNRQLADEGKWPTDQEIHRFVRSVDFYGSSSVRRQRKLVLCGIEEALNRSQGMAEMVSLTDSGINIEHLMPQSPDSNSKADLKEAAANSNPRVSGEELHERLVNLIGNLTLTGANRKLGNLPFHRKKSILRDSRIQMNQEIVVHERWGPEEILARCARLGKLAIQVWPGPLKQS